jgi:hypothetical protein
MMNISYLNKLPEKLRILQNNMALLQDYCA